MKGIFKRIVATIMVAVMFISASYFCNFSCLKVSAGSVDSFSDYKQGDSFWFGRYPQERETNQKIINALDQMFKPVGTLLSNEQYYKYGDVSYCKLNGYWYRISQIEWQVMYVENKNNKELLLVSKKVLDYQQYNSSGKATTWEKCSLNKWLNTTFIDRAFTKTERSYIKKNIIEGATNKVFILSYTDAQNPKYGFSNSPTYDDPMRRTSGTDFAIDSGSGSGMCKWILREDGVADQFHYALDGENEGCIGECHGTVGISTSMGIRPAIRVNNMVESTGKETTFTDDGVSGKVYLDFQDRYFLNGSLGYNHELARFCSQLVTIGYGKKYEINNALKSIGFENIEIEKHAGRDQINYFIAQRKVMPAGNNSTSYTLIFIGLIGSHKAQWYSNFDPMGLDSESGIKDCPENVHRGFWDAKTFAHRKLEEYVNTMSKKNSGALSSGRVKLLIAGHSRGAATSNLLAADIIDANGISIGKYSNCSQKHCVISNDDVYTYAFATPNSSAQKENNAYVRDKECYKRIYNIVNPEDFVTKVMPKAWGFGNFGTTYSLPSKSTYDAGKYNKILNKMQMYYRQMTSGAEYHPYKNGINTVNKLIDTFAYFIDYKGFYSKTPSRGITPLRGYYEEEISPYVFFKNTLCTFVAGEPSKVVISSAAKCINILSSNMCHRVYGDFVSFFVDNEALGMIDKKILSSLNFVSEYFAEAHKAETYCAFIMSMSSDEIQKPEQVIKHVLKYSVKCPVDIEIYYKSTGELVGRIINNVVDETVAAKENSIIIFVDGDEKVFYLPNEQDYEIKLIGNDDGTMDYSVSKVDEEKGEIERTNYYDVAIKNGESLEYKQNGNDGVCLIDEKQNVLNADEVMGKENFNDINISIISEGIGYAGEFIPATRGDYISLKAETDMNNSFLGWYEDNKLISADPNYSFVAKQNRNLVAKFTNIVVDVTGVTLSDDAITLNRFGDNSFAFMKCSILPLNATTQTVVWSSSDDTVASVDESGTVIAVSPGTAVITATTDDGKYTTSCNVTVKNNIGDVNDDGLINSLDALIALQISVGQIETSADMFDAADVCKDNNINSIDALMILMYSVGEITSFD